MKHYTFLNESYTALALGGSSIGWLIARQYTDELRGIVLTSNTPEQAIESIKTSFVIESTRIKEAYIRYIMLYSDDPNWKIYVLNKIERRKLYGLLIGAVAGAGVQYGIEKSFPNE